MLQNCDMLLMWGEASSIAAIKEDSIEEYYTQSRCHFAQALFLEYNQHDMTYKAIEKTF